MLRGRTKKTWRGAGRSVQLQQVHSRGDRQPQGTAWTQSLSNVELLLSRDRVGIGRVSQGKHLIRREVVYRRHGRQTIKFLIGGDVKDPDSAVAVDHVIAALELAVGFEPFTLLGLLRDGVDQRRGQAGHTEIPQDEKFHKASPPGLEVRLCVVSFGSCSERDPKNLAVTGQRCGGLSILFVAYRTNPCQALR